MFEFKIESILTNILFVINFYIISKEIKRPHFLQYYIYSFNYPKKKIRTMKITV